MAHLEIALAGGQIQVLPLVEGENQIGSGPQATIRLADPMIAPLQAVIRLGRDQCAIRNLDTARPVFLNFVPLQGEQPLQPGDQLILGSTRCRFFPAESRTTGELLEISMSQPGGAVVPGTPTIATAPAESPSPAPEPPVSEEERRLHAHFEIREPGGGSRWFLVKAKEMLIGRSRDADLLLRDPAVDSRHAKVIRREGEFFLVDMESLNGVFLNGRRIYRETFQPGDLIRIGQTELAFHAPLPPPEPPAAPAPAPEATAVPKPVAPRPGKWPWVALGGLMAIILLAAGGFVAVKLISGWRARDSAGETKKRADDLIRQRKWEAAAELIASGEGALLQQEEREKIYTLTQLEQEAEGHDATLREYLGLGNVEAAMEYLKKIPPGSVYRPAAVADLAALIERRMDGVLERVELGGQDFSEVITLAEKLLQIRPDDPVAFSYICLARLGLGDTSEALQAAERMITAHPRNGDGYYFKAMALYRAGNRQEALPLVNQAVGYKPDESEFLFLRAKIYILSNRLADARMDLAKVLAAEPGHTGAKALYDQLTGQPAARAKVAEKPASAQYGEQLKRRRQAGGGAAPEQQARQAYLRGDIPAARQHLDRLSQSAASPEESARWRRLRDDIGQAEQLYQQGLALSQTDFPAALVKWEQLRQLETAIAPGQKSRFSLEVAGRAAGFFAERALADLQGGQADRAYELAVKALAWQPGHEGAQGVIRQVEATAEKMYLEGFRHYQQGDAAHAREYWEKVCRLVPATSTWHAKAREKLSGLEENR